MTEMAPDYVTARRVLLDALTALSPHLDNLVLVGAQAVYHHTGEGDLNVPMRMSAATYLAAGILVDSRRDPVATRLRGDLIAGSGLTIEPVTYEQALIARQAYRDFGCGSGHPAQFNFGDCFSYALARSRDEHLLFKGNDFIHTDIRPD